MAWSRRVCARRALAQLRTRPLPPSLPPAITPACARPLAPPRVFTLPPCLPPSHLLVCPISAPAVCVQGALAQLRTLQPSLTTAEIRERLLCVATKRSNLRWLRAAAWLLLGSCLAAAGCWRCCGELCSRGCGELCWLPLAVTNWHKSFNGHCALYTLQCCSERMIDVARF